VTKNLNLGEAYARRSPMTLSNFQDIINKDFVSFQVSLLPSETAFCHWLRVYLDISYEELPKMTDLHNQLDVRWADTILAVSAVAMIEDASNLALIEMLKYLCYKTKVLYVCMYALLFSCVQGGRELEYKKIEEAILATANSTHEMKPADDEGTPKLLPNGVPAVVNPSVWDTIQGASIQGASTMDWDLQAALYDDRWEGVCLMDLLEESPKTGSWGLVCKTLMKTYPPFWELNWSNRFRIYLCTFLT